MKKIFICFTILICFLVLGNIKNVSAVEFDTDDIENSTYVIGKCMFTREVSENYSGTLTTDVIMLAAKTITGNSLEDMVIYYKNARGNWVNALTNQSVEMDETVEIDYKDNEIYVETPTLYNDTLATWESAFSEDPYVPSLVDGKYYYDLGVAPIITGFEIYEKIGEDYEKVGEGLLHNPEVIQVAVEPGQRKVFVARTYATKENGDKVYSDYSNEIVIDHTEYATPVLSNDTLKQWNTGFPDEDYIPRLVEGVYIYDLGIDTSSYVYPSWNSVSISGYEIYEKVGNTYVEALIGTVGGVVVVNVQPGERKVYVARVYATKANGDKVYSDYSNEIVIDHTEYATPVLSNDTLKQWNTNSPDEDYIPNLVEGVYTYDLGIDTLSYVYPSLNSASISGYEVSEKVGNTYGDALIGTVGGAVVVTVQPGERKVYVARVYATKANGDKVYSDYSNEIVIDHRTFVTPELENVTLKYQEDPDDYEADLSDEGYIYDLGLKNADAYRYFHGTMIASVSVSGYEVYEKAGTIYTPISSCSVRELGTVSVTIEPGERKVYVTRVYATKANGDKVYSDYSNEIVIDHSN